VSIGEQVSFDPAPSKLNGVVSSVRWKIGNDSVFTSSTLSPVQYRFQRSGTYEIALMIDIQSSSSCNSASVVKKILVNEPPFISWNIPTDAALGDRLVLDASKSGDTDGIIAQYDWKIDGKQIGTTPVVTAAQITAGVHTVELTITDNSQTATRSVRKQATVRINSKPNPTFSLAEPLYENEMIILKPEHLRDADSDTLTFAWRINDAAISSDSIRLSAGRMIITLIANDGRGVRNSIDSVQKEFFVIAQPTFTAGYPKDWIIGTEINANQLFSNGTINFAGNIKIQPTWIPTTTGVQSATVVWTPTGKVLASNQFTITVWDSLEFTDKPSAQTIIWNPSNPSIILTAPKVNRPENSKIGYEWRKGKEIFGVGTVVEGKLNRGKNIFTLRAIDQDIQGAHSVEIEVLVFCE
jgi:hypothetical protein